MNVQTLKAIIRILCEALAQDNDQNKPDVHRVAFDKLLKLIDGCDRGIVEDIYLMTYGTDLCACIDIPARLRKRLDERHCLAHLRWWQHEANLQGNGLDLPMGKVV